MQFDPDHLLRMLNRGLNERTVEFSLRSAAQRGEIAIGTVDEFRDAAAKFQTCLVELVDEWIWSGLNPEEDLDYPRKRKLRQGSKAWNAQMRWLNSHSPRFTLTATGEPEYDFRLPPISHRRSSTPPGPTEVMQTRAIAEFVSLMQSPVKYNLAKCSRCERYHFRKKVREFYNGKSFCAECRSAASVEADRKKRREDKLTEAAKLWGKWDTLSAQTRSKYGTRENYLVERLGLTLTFISRNRSEIAQSPEGASHNA